MFSDKYCVNLNTPMKLIDENDQEVFQKKINQDRIMVMQVRHAYLLISILSEFDSYRQRLYE